MAKRLDIFLIAVEPSGDALGASLMAALRAKTGDSVGFRGVGGPQMEAEGLTSLFPYDELAIMGLVEVVPRLWDVYRRMRQMVGELTRRPPDALVTIDAPGFTLNVAKRLRAPSYPRIHYVAPSVWAWRPGRVHKFQRHFDHLLTLLPFEPPLFEEVGLSSTFVGHPVIDGGASEGDGAGLRRRYRIAADDILVCVLPGSRVGEVRRLIGPFGQAMARLHGGNAGIRAVIPAMPNVEPLIRAQVKDWPLPVKIVSALDERYDAMAASNIALAASGTVALELALARVPTVIAYRVAPVTAWVLRRLLKIRHVNLINILLDRGAVPELLQKDATPEKLAAEIERLLSSDERREGLLEAQDRAVAKLHPVSGTPGGQAAEAVLRVIEDSAPASTQA